MIIKSLQRYAVAPEPTSSEPVPVSPAECAVVLKAFKHVAEAEDSTGVCWDTSSFYTVSSAPRAESVGSASPRPCSIPGSCVDLEVSCGEVEVLGEGSTNFSAWGPESPRDVEHISAHASGYPVYSLNCVMDEATN